MCRCASPHYCIGAPLLIIVARTAVARCWPAVDRVFVRGFFSRALVFRVASAAPRTHTSGAQWICVFARLSTGLRGACGAPSPAKRAFPARPRDAKKARISATSLGLCVRLLRFCYGDASRCANCDAYRALCVRCVCASCCDALDACSVACGAWSALACLPPHRNSFVPLVRFSAHSRAAGGRLRVFLAVCSKCLCGMDVDAIVLSRFAFLFRFFCEHVLLPVDSTLVFLAAAATALLISWFALPSDCSLPPHGGCPIHPPLFFFPASPPPPPPPS